MSKRENIKCRECGKQFGYTHDEVFWELHLLGRDTPMWFCSLPCVAKGALAFQRLLDLVREERGVVEVAL